MNPCKRKTVYAVGLENNDRIRIVYAYNYNETECTGVEGKCGCIHAEIALLKKMPKPKNVYVSLSPCLDCAKALVRAGVKRVCYTEQYCKTDGIDYLKSNGVEVERKDG